MSRIAIVALAFFALAAGCRTMTTDRVPSGEQRGYVEFYVASGENLGFQVPIYEVIDGKDYPAGSACLWNRWTTRRVAAEPGKHVYLVALGTARKKVTVEVEEGMIVPVRITLTRDEDGKSAFKDVKFTMALAREAPIDPAEYDDWRGKTFADPE
jgi:hypothetical protein